MARKNLPRVLLRLLSSLHGSSFVPDRLSIALEKVIAVFRRTGIRYGIAGQGILFAQDNHRRVFFSNRQRGFSLYRGGILAREKFIFKSYCLQNIAFGIDDVVFDCGANSGDLFLKLSKMIRAENYFAFEPNPDDFRVLGMNLNGKANLFDLALGNVNSELSFYTATSRGDSSLVEPGKWDEKISVSVIRLDTFIADRGIESIKLLKIEAEGFEPEILEGLGGMLHKCEYVAVDGGYERGRDREQTFTTCTNYLISNGFEIIDVFFPWKRALYKRK